MCFEFDGETENCELTNLINLDVNGLERQALETPQKSVCMCLCVKSGAHKSVASRWTGRVKKPLC